MTLLDRWEGDPVEDWRRLWDVPELEIHDVVPSTMERAWSRVEAGAAPGTLVLAEEQGAGKGRSGGGWYSPPGTGLWVSLILGPPDHPPRVLPLRVGLAVAEAVDEVAKTHVAIKWPNDLFLGDGEAARKVGGILVEMRSGGVVVGVGLNVRHPDGGFPGALGDVATSLDSAGVVSRADVASAVFARLRPLATERSPSTELTRAELAELAERDLLRGRRVRTRETTGEAVGVDGTGALRVRRGDGTVTRTVAGGVDVL